MTDVDHPNLNQDQRMIIVGSAVKEKPGTVALWLRDHSIDITVIEVQAYKEGDSILVQPTTIVPLQVKRFADTGRIKPEGTPWTVDGRKWHLDKRCSPKTREMYLKLEQILLDRFDLDGPRWNQKYYIAFRIGNYNWLAVHGTPTFLRLSFHVKAGVFEAGELAKELGVVEFVKDETLADKLNLPSSILVTKRNENTDKMVMRAKDDFDLEGEAFLKLLDDAYEAFPK